MAEISANHVQHRVAESGYLLQRGVTARKVLLQGRGGGRPLIIQEVLLAFSCAGLPPWVFLGGYLDAEMEPLQPSGRSLRPEGYMALDIHDLYRHLVGIWR